MTTVTASNTTSSPSRPRLAAWNPRWRAPLLAAALALLALEGCARPDDHDDGVGTVNEGFTEGCSDAFASCVRGGGGGACASRYCSSSCADEVARCVKGGGGAGCASRCSSSSSTSTCEPQQEWTTVGTSECGINVPPFEGTTGGEAKATCTTECDGTRTCSVWHDDRGRAQCTLGAPVDSAGNYW